MNVVFRFNKGYGNDRLYYRLRSATNEYFDFVTQELSTVETASTKIFLTELEDSQDPWENMYTGTIPQNKVGWYEEEVVDQLLDLVIGEGTVENRVTYRMGAVVAFKVKNPAATFRMKSPPITFRLK